MHLVVDAGNSSVVVGLYKGELLKDHFRIGSRADLSADELGFFVTNFLERMHIANEQVELVTVCSVVPSLTNALETMGKRHLGCLPIVLSADLELPIKLEVDQPGKVGTDRIANAVASYNKFGGPVISVDIGTATNIDVVDVVNGEGAFIGGVLLPGPQTAMADLSRRAAQLVDVKFEKPNTVVGKSTKAALKSGLFYGTIGQLDYVLEKIIEEAGFNSPTIVATGGLAGGVEKHSRFIKLVEPMLTLEGIRLIGEAQ